MEEKRKENIKVTEDLIDFIHRSPSRYHAVANAEALLQKAGFTELNESQRWIIERGMSYYVKRNSSALIGFRIPREEECRWSMISAHTDSPSFKIKGKPEIASDQYTTLNVEGYGGMLMAPWFDRPLSIAGRVFIQNGGKVEERLVDFDQDLCQIVNLAIHQNREANNGIAYKVQQDLLPIIGLGKKPGLISKMISSKLGIAETDILDSDLFLYNRTRGTIWGAENELFSSAQIDDLQCAYCAIQALIAAKDGASIKVSALFDNEEVGSGTRQGALSDFLCDVVDRIGTGLGWDSEKKYMSKSVSLMVSADNGHAFHPNHPETSDVTNHILMNGGVVIKYSGNQKYATDAGTGAKFKAILRSNEVPYQEFFNNSNIPGGSTLGNLSTTKYSIPTVDIGAAQLAMHSPYETAGTDDTSTMLKAMKCFLEN